MPDEVKRRPPMMRIAPEDLGTIERRHTPMHMPEVLICSRCEEIWPCDARQLLDRLGVPRPSFVDAVGHRVDTPTERL